MATPFDPRRGAKGRGELQHLFVQGGPRKECFDPRRATKDREEHLCPRRTRRGTENFNTFLSAEGHGKNVLIHEGPLRAAKNIFVHGGRGKARRTSFIDARRGAKNTL